MADHPVNLRKRLAHRTLHRVYGRVNGFDRRRGIDAAMEQGQEAAG
jgi:hypothetical protein